MIRCERCGDTVGPWVVRDGRTVCESCCQPVQVQVPLDALRHVVALLEVLELDDWTADDDAAYTVLCRCVADAEAA